MGIQMDFIFFSLSVFFFSVSTPLTFIEMTKHIYFLNKTYFGRGLFYF